MKLLKILNDENIPDEEVKTFKHRHAVRIVAFDKEGNIALVYARAKGYYALPGGGVEENETFEEGAIREAREETGCDVKITGEVGSIEEYLKQKNIINESFCYIANVIGEKKGLNLMKDEIDEGMEIIWIDINEAIRLINKRKEKNIDVTSLQVNLRSPGIRDAIFLEEVKKIKLS